MSLVILQVILVVTLVAVILVASISNSNKQDDVKAGKIVHGVEVPEGELEYQASIQVNFGTRLVSSKSTHFCGGAFIAKDWILTAAHCVRNQDARKLKVVGGTTDITDKSRPAFAVEKMIMHKYNDIIKQNDIAIVKVNSEGDSDDNIVPVPLCDNDFDPSGVDCKVSGWGHLKAKGSSVPDKLRQVSVTVLKEKQCMKMLAGYPWDAAHDTMICAGGGEKDACQGDSGGPLVCPTPEGVCVAGIVSWGVGCATEGIPGVYSNVRKYNRWIMEQMEGRGNPKEVGNNHPGLLGLLLDFMETLKSP